MTSQVAVNVAISNCNTTTSSKGEVSMSCFDIEKVCQIVGQICNLRY